ncbi:MAG: hypothetical protein KC496_04470 [Anaerolineae bacterium]|nr:hypothetical protein [Anaerolineae bacterium]
MIFLWVCGLILPLLLTTYVLAKRARQQLQGDLERLLHEMNFAEVEDKVRWAQRHTVIFGGNAAASLLFFLLSEDTLPKVLWLYALGIHGLALYLYHVRWNPGTLERKRKIDLADLQATEDIAFDPDATYTISEEGELILVEEAAQGTQSHS